MLQVAPSVSPSDFVLPLDENGLKVHFACTE
jgi:hypothetical protein